MKINGKELDELDSISQQILTALYKRHRANTSELREMIGLEGDGAGRKIRHRMDEHLIPSEIVEEVGREEHPGNDVRVYQITRDGQRAVEDEWQRLDHFLQRHEVMDAQRETRGRVDLLHDLHDETRKRQDDLEGDFGRLEGKFQGLQGNFSELRNRVEKLEKELEKESEERRRLKRKLNKVDERSNLLVEQISEVKQVADEAWMFVNWIGKKIAYRQYEDIQPPEELEQGRSLSKVRHNNHPSKNRKWSNQNKQPNNTDDEITIEPDDFSF